MKINKEIKIAITAILSIIIIYSGIIFLKGTRMLGSENIYYVEMNDIGGLTVSSEVTVNGLCIGNVKGIEFNVDKQNLIVAIDINEGFVIPEGTTATISKEMLGSVKMNLQLGKNSNKAITINDTIRGKASVDLMSAAAEMIPQMQSILPKIDSILTSVNNILADSSINRTINNVEYVTNNLRTATDDINGLLNKDLPSLLSRANEICNNAMAITDNISKIDINAFMSNANNTMQNLQVFTNRLNQKDNSLGLLLNDTKIYNNIDSTIQNASMLLQDIRVNPKKYVHFSLFGKNSK